MKTAYKEYRQRLEDTLIKIALVAKKKKYDAISFQAGYEYCIHEIRRGNESLHLIKPKELLTK